MSQRNFSHTDWFVVGATAVWTAVLAAFALVRHGRLNSSAYDLAIKSQVIWNTSQGDWFASSIEVAHYLGDHVQLIMLPLAALYWLWADVRVMLLVQALLLGVGAIPLYRIAKRDVGNPLAAVFAIAYLLYPALGFINRFDFHMVAFAIPFFLWAYDLLEAKRPMWATLFILLALTCREEVGLTVFAFGLYLIVFEHPRRRIGALWATAGLAWSAVALFYIIPTFRGATSDTTFRYTWLGDGPAEMLVGLFTRPGLVFEHLTQPFRLSFINKIFLPLGYLSLLHPIVLVGLPALGYNLLSDVPSQSSIYFQYISPLIPFIFIAAVRGASRLQGDAKQRARTLALVSWVVLFTAVAFILDNPFTKPIRDPYFEVYATQRLVSGEAFERAQRLIPADASVSATMALLPHLSLRREMHLFQNGTKLRAPEAGFPLSDYLVLDVDDRRWGLNGRLYDTMIERAIGQYGYEAIFFEDDIALLTRTAEPQPATGALVQRLAELEAAGSRFVPTSQETLDWAAEKWLVDELPATAEPLAVTFAPGIELVGVDVRPAKPRPGGAACARLYWRTTAEAPLDDYAVFFHLNAFDGFVLTQRDSLPAQGYYPTSRWRPAEIITDLHCLQIPPQVEPGMYMLTAGLYDPETGERVEVVDGGAAEIPLPNAVLVCRFEVER